MSYDWYSQKPLHGLTAFPEHYNLLKSEIPLVKKLQKLGTIVGGTFIVDLPVQFVAVPNLKQKFKVGGLAYSPQSRFVVYHYIAFDASMLAFPEELRAYIHHELGHLLVAAYGEKDVWHMNRAKELKKYQCSSDMDRWTWHMQRALEQLTWREPAWAQAWKA